MTTNKLPVPTDTLETSDSGVVFQSKINTLFSAVKNAITAFNTQIDAAKTATAEVSKVVDLTSILNGNMRAKADMDALREKNLNDYKTGSGFLEFGKHFNSGDRYVSINEGMWSDTGNKNVLYMGVNSTKSDDCISRTDDPLVLVDGIKYKLSQINSVSKLNIVNFPAAPDGTKTLNTIGNVLTTHANATLAFAAENATTKVITSAADLVVLRTTELELAGNQAYPLGNMMFSASMHNGVSTNHNGTDNLLNQFGPWDTETVGKGWDWDGLSAANRNAIIADDENNIYNDNGVAKQSAYHIKTHQGFKDYRPSEYKQALIDHGYTESTDPRNKGLWTITEGGRNFLCIPICLQGRFNMGAKDQTYNPHGCGRFWNADNVTNAHYNWSSSSAKKPTSLRDCMSIGSPNAAGIFATVGDISSGYTGRDDQYKYHDVIYAGRCMDIRLSCREPDLEQDKRNSVAGNKRGSSRVPFTKVFFESTTVSGSGNAVTSTGVGDFVEVGSRIRFLQSDGSIYDGNVTSIDDANQCRVSPTWTGGKTSGNYIVAEIELSAEYNSIPQVDLICSPSALSVTFSDGCVGRWISVLPDGTNKEFPLNIDSYKSTTLGIATIAGSGSWGKASRVVDVARNSITVSYGSNDVALQFYESRSGFTEPSVNENVIGSVGDVLVTDKSDSRLLHSLIDKVGKSNFSGVHRNTVFNVSDDKLISLSHEMLTIPPPINNSPAVKVCMLHTEIGGFIYPMYQGCELQHNDADWGDDNTINAVDNESTKINDNAVAVKTFCHIGQFPIGVA